MPQELRAEGRAQTALELHPDDRHQEQRQDRAVGDQAEVADGPLLERRDGVVDQGLDEFAVNVSGWLRELGKRPIATAAVRRD